MKLESLFGKFNETSVEAWGGPERYSRILKTKDFFIWEHTYAELGTLYCVDHIDCYNKEGQCPICFVMSKDDLSDLIAALEFLKTDLGKQASNDFSFEKFPHKYGQHVRKT